MRAIDIIFKILLSLILLTPILGILGIFPAPTRNLYHNDLAFQFIQIIMNSKYINYMMCTTFAISIFCIWTSRVALASLLILPIVLNIVGFHAFLDGGLLTGGAVMGNILLIINLYFLWQNKKSYIHLLKKS